MELIKELENLFVDRGLHIRDIDLEDETWRFKVFLDNGEGLGVFHLPRCSGPNCLTDDDIYLYFKYQCFNTYPEIFKEKGKE